VIAERDGLESLRERLAQIEEELRGLGYETDRCVNPAGARIAHQVFGDEILILVLFGKLRTESDGRLLVLGVGDRLCVPAGVPFTIEVLGETSAYWIQAHRPDPSDHRG